MIRPRLRTLLSPGISPSLLDFKLGVRMLRKYPGLTLVGGTGLMVAVALGAVFFEWTQDMFFPEIPLDEPDRIVSIQNWDVAAGDWEYRSLNDLERWRGVGTIEDLSAVSPTAMLLETRDGRSDFVLSARVTSNLFGMLRVSPALGRPFDVSDEVEADGPVILLGHAAWERIFDGDPQAIGQVITVGTTRATVVGVMPPGFGFPRNQEAWLPLDRALLQPGPREGVRAEIFGRLKPGATLDDAQAELAAIGASAAQDLPDTHAQLQPRVRTFVGRLVGPGVNPGAVFGTYASGIFFVLLMVVIGANISTLVFARTAAREEEIAIRAALGATRRTLVAQLVVEALVLSGLAAVLGLVVAQWAVRRGAPVPVAEEYPPFWWNEALSSSTILYAVALSLVGAVIVGGLPAMKATRGNLRSVLAQVSTGRPEMKLAGRWSVLIVLQVAVSVAFLPLALSEGIVAIRGAQADGAFAAESFLTASMRRDLDLGALDAPADSLASPAEIWEETRRRVEAEPGVTAVTFASGLPGADLSPATVLMDGGAAAGGETTQIRTPTFAVDVDYFETMGASMAAGRPFNEADGVSEPVVIVSTSFVRDFLGGQNPLGRRLRYPTRPDGADRWYEIVGVVGEVPIDRFARHGNDVGIYHPLAGEDLPRRQMFVAFSGEEPDQLAARLRYRITSVDPSLQVGPISTVARVWEMDHQSNRFFALTIGLLAFVGVLLAMASVQALMAFAVARRRREIGIRVAVGADRVRIMRLVLSRALLQLAVGVLIGCVVAFAAFGDDLIESGGLITIPLLALILLVAGLLACLAPALRALRIQPTEALKANV